MRRFERSDVAVAVADAFDLGAVVDGWERVPGGRSHLLWKLRTTTGVWAVKQLNRAREPWWMADYLVAAAVQDAAFRCGVAMPRPVRPLRPVAPMLADIPIVDRVVSFLVHDWCAGEACTGVDTSPDVLAWVGETLAVLHALPVALDVEEAQPHRAHPVAEWTEWLDDAAGDIPVGFVRAVRDFLPEVARAKDIVDQALPAVGRELRPVFTHRDVKPDNVLLTPASPVLVDWDGAGLDVAEWEAIRAALAFSRSGSGRDPRPFRRVVRTYEAASGRTIPPETASFAGMLQSQLSGAAWLLFRALGHRPVTPPERAAAYVHTLEILGELRTSLEKIEQWTAWLDDAPQP